MARHLIVRTRLLVLAGLAVVLLAACQPVPYSAGPGPRVFRTGDSVLWDSDALVRSGLQDAGFRTASAVYPGTSIGWSAERIMEQVWGDDGSHAPDVVLVASGNMNVTGGWTADDAEQTRTLLEWAWPEGRCTAWVLPATVRHPGSGTAKRSVVDADAAAVADGIRRTITARGAHVIDWAHLAAQHPEWYQDDGVHHTGAGKAAYASFVVSETRRLCRI